MKKDRNPFHNISMDSMTNAQMITPKPASSPKIVDVQPTGSQILVEILSAQEACNTAVFLSETSEDIVLPQGYVIAVGPSLKNEAYGFKVGDRVLLQGSFVPVPRYDEKVRKKGLVEVHTIKAVLVEENHELTT